VTLRLGVLASGSGTNLQAIMDACEAGTLDAEVAVVISDREDAFALERARGALIPAVHLDRVDFMSSGGFNAAIRDALEQHGVEWVVMAGYMRLLGKEVLDAFPNQVLNIHPALLPSFAGAQGIADTLDYGAKVAGVTVHFANENFDEGPIIAQEAIPVLEDDTVTSLAERIHEIEHRIYPAVLQAIAEERVQISGRRVKIAPPQ
jgi:phosphoribosylglycinamide formyltransferase 1